jgi:hypothetical protein
MPNPAIGDYGRYFDQNKEIVSVIYGSGVYFNVGVAVRVKNFTSSYFSGNTLAVETVEILCPEVNVRPPHKI